MISFPQLLALMLLTLVAWFWFDNLKAREQGIKAVQAACKQEGVQLLDETVSGRFPRLVRDESGRMVMKRVYEFEYSSSGQDRFYGAIMLIGTEVAMLDISAHTGERLVH